MERLLMRESQTILGKIIYYICIALFAVTMSVLLFLALQGVPALGAYLQSKIGIVKTGYYFMGLVFVLTPSTMIYILFSKK